MKRKLTLGIDASNIKTGGGLTHLLELLREGDSIDRGFDHVIVWGGKQLENLPPYKWLERRILPSLDENNLVGEFYWRLYTLPKLAQEACDILFSPGGMFVSNKICYVSMSQNMLIWEGKERARFGLSDRFKLRLMRFMQRRSFQSAAGIIFISEYARKFITQELPSVDSKPSVVVYHGINDRFRTTPSLKSFGVDDEIKLIYVSTIHHYKWQWKVIGAVKKIRENEKIDLKLSLIGGAKPSVLAEMNGLLAETSEFVNYKGVIPYEEIEENYHESDVFVFASTCENMPNIVVEAMASSLPITSSNFGPMPEILLDGCIYFDPTNSDSIADALLKIIRSPELQNKLKKAAYQRSQYFNWQKAASETFTFLKETAERAGRK
jgi:glycosyltransferase involved in cell wall biosynthesis